MALEPRGRWAEQITSRAKPAPGMEHSCGAHRQEDSFLAKAEGSFQPLLIRKPVWATGRRFDQPPPQAGKEAAIKPTLCEECLSNPSDQQC